jgi:hypothetical protein
MKAEDLGNVIIATKKIEQILEANYGAAGRGLHEKVSSVSGELDDQLLKQLRYIASVRNKAVHESDFSKQESEDFFTMAGNVSSILNANKIVQINRQASSSTVCPSDTQSENSGLAFNVKSMIQLVLQVFYIGLVYSYCVDLVGISDFFLINVANFILAAFMATITFFAAAELFDVKLVSYKDF